MKTKMLKRAVIKEELVAITGDFISALILNQFLYWSERIDFVDKYIKEEGERENTYGQNPDGTYAKENINYNSLLSQGFVYKKASELNEELMLNLSEVSIRKYIKALVLKGFLIQRTNPKYKWDKTFQYRVDLLKVRESLDIRGCSLDGYAILKNLAAKQRNFAVEQENFAVELRNLAAIPEITTEITTEITKEEEKKTSSLKDSLKDKKDKPRYDPDIENLALRLADFILFNNPKNVSLAPDKRKKTILLWCADIDKLHRVDKQSIGDIIAVIEWCQKDNFWKNNILSASKLRKQWDKLFLKMRDRKKVEPKTSPIWLAGAKDEDAPLSPVWLAGAKDENAPPSPVWLAGAIEGEPKPSPVWLVGADDY